MTWTLGVDVGTYETKGVLVDNEGNILASASRPHIVDFPSSGRAEHDPENVWWEGFLEVCRQINEIEPEARLLVAAISVSGVGPCVLPVDKQFNPLRSAILYGVDTRATQQINDLNDLFGEDKIFSKTGVLLSSQATLPKILWVKQNQYEIFKNSYQFVGPSTFINYRLTGVSAIDHYSAGSNYGLYDPKNNCWSDALLDGEFNLEKLPNIFWSNEIIGELHRQGSDATGYKVGTKVLAGTIDAAAEAVSACVVNPQELMLMYGSTHFIIEVTSTYKPSKLLWNAPFMTKDSHALLAGMSTTGSLTRWIRDNFASHLVAKEKMDGTSAYAELSKMADSSSVGANGLVTLPYFSGERTPINDPDARGVIAGLTLRHTLGDIYRSALEGIGFGIRQNIELFSSLGLTPKFISSVGGGTKSKVWLQCVSDITGMEQRIYDKTIGASYGNAFLAAMALDNGLNLSDISKWQRKFRVITPNLQNSKKYNELYSVYSSLYVDTKLNMHKLGKF